MQGDFIHMTQKTNYHTHTPLCRHALGNDISEYAKAAYDAGLSILGFSDHAPFKDHDLGYRMEYQELPLYFEQVDCLKQQYQGLMQIKKGLEIEYLPYYTKPNYSNHRNFYEYLLLDQKCDYLILGEHFFTDKDGTLFNLYNVADTEAYITYAKTCVAAMSTGYFDIIAHPDLFGVNAFSWDKNCDIASDLILEGATKYHVVVEYNANGYRRGIQNYPDGDRYMYPLENFWKKIIGSDIPVIIGSDNHAPEQIWDYAMVKAYDYLSNIPVALIETIEDNRYNKKK